tara:strand:+ start:399 stop:872 length:474 start_codon:yes stop_codon:yes gene_type:complete
MKNPNDFYMHVDAHNNSSCISIISRASQTPLDFFIVLLIRAQVNINEFDLKVIRFFQVITNNWKQYDWDALTTVVLFGALDNEMLCHAHANNVRVVWGTNYPIDQLANGTRRQEWIYNWIQQVYVYYTPTSNTPTFTTLPLFLLLGDQPLIISLMSD